MKQLRIFGLAILVLVLVVGCSSRDRLSDPNGTDNNLETGDPVTVYSGSIGASGGAETVSAPGEPVDGLEIDIPPDAFDSAVDLEISYAPIVSHNLGAYFNPVTPLVSIDLGDETSFSAVTVKIPYTPTPGHFAMPFVYDPDTKSLEPVAILTSDDESITMVARTFSDVVVSEISEAELESGTEIATGFLPGVDGWQNANYGSVKAAEGHCAGMSITSIWYYRKMGPPGLFNRFDNTMLEDKTPGFWKDDVEAIRLGSVVQEDPSTWRNYAQLYLNLAVTPDDEKTWKSILYAMKLGEPELICVHTDPDSGGHAVVAYGVDLQNHQVKVYDPNFIGSTTNYIQYNPGTKKFDPYNSRLNAREPSMLFPVIALYPVMKMCDPQMLEQFFFEVDVGTVGEFWFPDYEVYMHSDTGDKTRLATASPQHPDRVNFAKSRDITFSVVPQDSKYDEQLTLYEYDPLFSQDVAPVGADFATLNPADNYIGVEIEFKDTTVQDSEHVWTGFEWFVINLGPVIDEITPASGSPGDVVTVKGVAFGDGRQSYVYFGEQIGTTVSWSDTEIRVEIPEMPDGGVLVFVNINGTESNTVPFSIGDSLQELLNGTTLISVSPHGEHMSTEGERMPGVFDIYMENVKWQGLTFTADSTYTWSPSGGHGEWTKNLSGSVNPDDRTVSLTYVYASEVDIPPPWEGTEGEYFKTDITVRINNLDFARIHFDSVEFRVNGLDCANHVTLSYEAYNDPWYEEPSELNYSHTVWTDVIWDTYVTVWFNPRE